MRTQIEGQSLAHRNFFSDQINCHSYFSCLVNISREIRLYVAFDKSLSLVKV